MILGTTKGSANIPKGLTKLTKEEALEHQKNVIESWPSVTEVFFLRFGKYITTASAFLCSAACINVFHPLLKFGRGTITAVIPSTLLPSALVYYKTDKILTNDTLLLTMECPLCCHLKFLALQLYGSFVFPALLGLMNTNAGHGITYKKTDTTEYWKKTFALAKSRSSTFQLIICSQFLLAFSIPYMQKIEITKIMNQLNENQTELSEQVL